MEVRDVERTCIIYSNHIKVLIYKMRRCSQASSAEETVTFSDTCGVKFRRHAVGRGRPTQAELTPADGWAACHGFPQAERVFTTPQKPLNKTTSTSSRGAGASQTPCMAPTRSCRTPVPSRPKKSGPCGIRSHPTSSGRGELREIWDKSNIQVETRKTTSTGGL